MGCSIQFEKAQAIFTSEDNKRVYIKDSDTPYLLKGIMKCECCDSSLTPTYTKKSRNYSINYF